MTIEATVIADSISPAGARITTFQLRFPRVILPEFNTHRAFCLAGDAVLEFDLPGGSRGKYRRVRRMRIDEFVSKWLDGANRTASKPKADRDLSWIHPSSEYPAVEVASRLGMATATNIHSLCRSGTIPARKGERGEWLIFGRDVIAWRGSTPEHSRFDIRARLSGMMIRQLNEDTGDIQCSNVVAACRSGTKDVFEVVAGDYRVAGSADHRILTSTGWKPIKSIRRGDMIAVRKYGKKEDEKLDPLRLKKIDGVWRSRWQTTIRAELIAADPLCRRCREAYGSAIHHVVPVCVDPSRAIDDSNVTLLCEPCHKEMHSSQGWQGGNHLYGAFAEVDDVVFRGSEPTYDLQIAGEHANFVANGVIVHNSRNASSSRAIPWESMRQRVTEDPYIPIHVGKNRKGMQATEELSDIKKDYARERWLMALHDALIHADALAKVGVHKQILNRLVEPWAHVDVVCTATDYSNFFALRMHADAMPEIQCLAVKMARALTASAPEAVPCGNWHMPYTTAAEQLSHDGPTLCKISAARCARTSFRTHDGRESAVAEDVALYERLVGEDPKHSSPTEHQAMASFWADHRSGNLTGWIQHRQMIAGNAAPPDFDWRSRLEVYGDRDYIV